MIWNDDTMRWMDVAASQSDFYPLLAQTLKNCISPNQSLCDVGCGMGFLSNALALQGFSPVGVDCSLPAIQFARERFGHTCSFFHMDVQNLLKLRPFHTLIFCQWGSPQEILRCTKLSSAVCFAVVARKYPHHICSPNPPSDHHRDTIRHLSILLNQLHIPFSITDFSAPLHQPFSDFNDAARFFSFYGQKNAPSVTPEEAMHFLHKQHNPQFPWVFPIVRDMSVLVFSKEGSSF